MARTVIIGAGLTGLSTAYHLEQAGYDDYLLFEKEAEIGGLCRSIRQDGFVFDYTGHLLHINDDSFRQIIKDTISFKQLNHLTRKSRIYNHGCTTYYPFQTNLYGFPPETIATCIEGFIKRKKIKNPKTFYSWVLTHFGKGFGRKFFFPYQQKLCCYNPKKITSSWTGRFVPKTDLETIIRGSIQPQSSIGYNATFYYPKKGGIDQLTNAIASKIQKPINTCYEVKTINLTRKEIIFTNGYRTTYDILINTMPLNLFLQKIIDKSTTNFHHQYRHLIANSILNINLGIARKNLGDYHWLYVPDSNYPFYRLGFSHYFAQSMAPNECSALYIECSYLGKKDSALPDYTLKKIKKFFKLNDDEIIMKQELTIPHAYVIYNFWRERHLATLLARLAENGIYSIGRYGAWKYSSMQEAIMDGKYNGNYIINAREKRIYSPTI